MRVFIDGLDYGNGVVALRVALVLVAMTGVGTAQAAVPSAVSENWDSVTQFYQQDVLAADTPCDDGCSALVADLKAPPSNPAGARQTAGQLVRTVPPVPGEPPVWLDGLKTLSVVGGLLVGNYYVWKYKVFGAHPQETIARVPQPPQQVADYQFSNGPNPYLFLTYFDAPTPPPVGYIARTYSRAAVVWDEGGRCAELQPPLPPGMEDIRWHWNSCPTGDYTPDGSSITVPIYAHGWNYPLSEVFSAFGSGATAPSNAPTITVSPNTSLTAEQIRQRLEARLNADGTEYDQFRDWLDSVLGGSSKNPRYSYHKVPSCTGVSAEACVGRLRDAGFTGTIGTATLGSDDAVMEQLANIVTATSPAAAAEVVEHQEITVYRNPPTMPAMTPAQTSISESLKAKNPDSVTDENKKTIARTCGRSSSDCLALPILVTGNDAAAPAKNDRDALSRNPAWFLIHHRNETGIPGRGSWYRNKPGCEKDRKPASTSQCDEFPFWSTLQAYNGAFNSGPGSLTPSIMCTPGKENNRQGGALRHFYSANRGGTAPDSFPFDGCDIPEQNEGALPPLLPLVPGARELAAAPSAFLNVPLGAHVPFKTIGFCNRPVTR